MDNHVYKVIEMVGTSPEGIDAAIRNALARAEESVRHIRWFEVVQVRGHVEDGKIGHYQATLKLGFKID